MEVNKEKIRYILQFFINKGENGQTVNSDIYCQQLDRLKLGTDQKRSDLVNRRGVVLHQDKARPHTSVEIRQKLWELGWKVLMHPHTVQTYH
ncbi:mariner transposase [Trichonephila clavipes]|nr:mariner transposase [Trichonephila clavipes]